MDETDSIPRNIAQNWRTLARSRHRNARGQPLRALSSGRLELHDMSADKIDPRLLEEMARAERDAPQPSEIPVLIQLTPILTPEESGLLALEQRVQNAQRGVRSKLTELGAAQSMRSLALANAIEAHLAPAGIREIAAFPEVTRILWNRAERVIV
jgi:hypothetical protein